MAAAKWKKRTTSRRLLSCVWRGRPARSPPRARCVARDASRAMRRRNPPPTTAQSHVCFSLKHGTFPAGELVFGCANAEERTVWIGKLLECRHVTWDVALTGAELIEEISVDIEKRKADVDDLREVVITKKDASDELKEKDLTKAIFVHRKLVKEKEEQRRATLVKLRQEDEGRRLAGRD